MQQNQGKNHISTKIIDELVGQKKDQDQKQKDIQRSSSPPLSTSSTTSSIFEEIKQTRSKVSTTTALFNNPFRKKVVINFVNETSATDELSKCKPSIYKSRLSSSNKTQFKFDFDVVSYF
jgi:hypothetical protein